MPRQSKPGPILAVVAGALTQIEFIPVGAPWRCQNIYRCRMAVDSIANSHATESHYNPSSARGVAIHPGPSGEMHRLSMNPRQPTPSKMMGVRVIVPPLPSIAEPSDLCGHPAPGYTRSISSFSKLLVPLPLRAGCFSFSGIWSATAWR